jgi:hypothetical protein
MPVESVHSHLTGGVFLYLLLQSLKKESRRRGLGNPGITESNCFMGLIRLIDPSYKFIGEEKTIKEDTSRYKHCKTENTAWMPFKDDSYIDKFDARIKNDYGTVLSEMIKWTEKYIDAAVHGNRIVTALFELLEDDKNIREDQPFYINNDGTQTLKKDLFKIIEIKFQPFILGIWHYLVCSKTINTDGQETILSISKSIGEAGSRHILNDTIGKTGRFILKVKVSEFPKEETFGLFDCDDILFEPNISPEITANPPIIAIPYEYLALSDDEFSSYLENLKAKYVTVKTLLFRQEPRDFYSIYECNIIVKKESPYLTLRKRLQNANIIRLSEYSNFIILTGTGGLGKSMMMRHLLLDSIDNYCDYKLVPIFISLKDFSSSYKDLLFFIYESFKCFDSEISIEEFNELLGSGRCLLLLDGLDEIKSGDRQQFEKQLDKFIDTFSKNLYILSSRPYASFISFSRFTIMDLCPFTKAQSIQLIQKLNLGIDEESLKQKFCKELDDHLYESHKEFAENPLLLTIMLMTYRQFADIPMKMHKFYSKSYDTLAQEHDASKTGYKRELNTKLTADRFADYFAEFSALTYCNENFELSETECKETFEQLKTLEEDGLTLEYTAFMEDLTSNMCLMYYEGQKYHFTHRSFQEYFCARYFASCKEKHLLEIASFFEGHKSRESDKTFAMLYDMKSKAVIENVFIPLLDDLFYKYEKEDGYLTFLRYMYPDISYDIGEVLYISNNEPKSFLYNFIATVNNCKQNIDSYDFPDLYDEFITEEWVYYDPNYIIKTDDDGFIYSHKGDDEELTSRGEVSQEYIFEFDEPEVVGRNYEFSMETIFSNPEEYDDLIKLLNQDDFPLKQEFISMQELLKVFKSEQKPKGKSLFDKLRS